MSNDVAVLGLAVDSTAVKTATTDLNSFAAAAKPAAVAATNLTAASDAHSLSLRGQRQVLGGVVSDLALLGGSYGSVASTLAALYVENSHLVEGWSGLRTAIAGILTPTNLLIGGLAGIAAGGTLAYLSIKNSELAFDDVSKSIGVTIGQLHGLDTAAAGKGIDTSDLQAAMTKFGASVYDAQNHMGTLATVFRANNVQAGTFADYLEKAADLIANAGSDQQKLQLLQQMGLPATMDWVRFLSDGADNIKAAIGNANQFGDTAEEQMIAKARAFDEAWASTWKNFKTGAQSAVVDAASYIDSLGGLLNSALMKIGVNVGKNSLQSAMLGTGVAGSTLTATSSVADFYSKLGNGAPGNGGAGAATVDPNVLQHQIQQQQPLLGLLGQAQPAPKQSEQKPTPTEKENDRDSYRKAA